MQKRAIFYLEFKFLEKVRVYINILNLRHLMAIGKFRMAENKNDLGVLDNV